MVSEGSECACLAPWTWEEHHGSRNTCEIVASWQKGSKEGADWERGVTLKSLLLERVPSFIYIPLTKTEALYRNRVWEEHFIPKPWLWSFDALVFGDNQKLQQNSSRSFVTVPSSSVADIAATLLVEGRARLVDRDPGGRNHIYTQVWCDCPSKKGFGENQVAFWSPENMFLVLD